MLNHGLTVTPDVAKDLLEITIGQSAAWLDGNVYIGDKVAEAATVHLNPTTPNRFRADLSRRVDTDQNGHFLFNSLPPGKYEVAAEDSNAAPDTSADRTKPSTSVELGKGEHKTILVKIH